MYGNLNLNRSITHKKQQHTQTHTQHTTIIHNNTTQHRKTTHTKTEQTQPQSQHKHTHKQPKAQTTQTHNDATIANTHTYTTNSTTQGQKQTFKKHTPWRIIKQPHTVTYTENATT